MSNHLIVFPGDYFLTCDIEHQAADPISAMNPSTTLRMDMWGNLLPVSTPAYGPGITLDLVPDSLESSGSPASVATAGRASSSTLLTQEMAPGFTAAGRTSVPVSMPRTPGHTGLAVSTRDSPRGSSSAVSTIPEVDSDPVPDAAPSTSQTRPRTRPQNNIIKPKRLFPGMIRYANICTSGELVSLFEALADPHWKASMEVEYNALLQNSTWHLVPANQTANVIDCKWVFKIKKEADGTLDRYKARLVAKGFKLYDPLHSSHIFKCQSLLN
jgi:hypothetical protein